MNFHASARLAVFTALALGITTASGSAASAADPQPAQAGPQADGSSLRTAPNQQKPFSARAADARERATYFVRFEGQGAAAYAAQVGGGVAGKQAAASRRGAVTKVAASALAVAKKADGQAASVYTISNSMPGAGFVLDQAGVDALAQDPSVESVTKQVPKTADLKSVDALTKAVNTWRFSGNTGQDVTIGVVDTGLDYTHADFGGKGTKAAYAAALANDTSPTWLRELPKRAKAKIVGGYDLAGDTYDSSGAAGSVVPTPDNNPLDCNGHGTHVSGIAAGYGVLHGKTFKAKRGKAYTKLKPKKLAKMDIGPGLAPQAKIYALRVFGCEGSTSLDIPAYDRALDPNGDGDFSDHLDIVNASLGQDYGAQDDPALMVVNQIARYGVLPVMSEGNGGDLTDVGGTPAGATAALAVASSKDKLETYDQLKVNAPADVAGTKPAQFSIAYPFADKPPVTGTVATLATPANLDGCSPFSAADAARVAGKVAWLEWDDNDATRRCGSAARAQNAANAGAIGAIFTSTLDQFAAGITGVASIPVVQLTGTSTNQLRASATAGTLNVTFDGSLALSTGKDFPAQTDQVSDFTSRGPHGSKGVIKPDVTAPGQTVGSAGFGTGNKLVVESGTSMASPATAGIAALVLAAHPKFSPLRTKAAIMNTARHDLFTGPGKTGIRYAPARVGAGRVDAKAAVTTKLLAYADAPDNAVSASFGVVPVPVNSAPVTKTQTVIVQNLNKKTVKVAAAYESLNAQPGVSYSVSPSKLKVKAKKKAKLTVTMTVTPSALRHTRDATMEATQGGVARQYVSDSSGRLLIKQKGHKANRVPVYGAAKATSATTAAISGNAVTLTGAGINTGTTSTDVRSLVSVTQLGATSPQLPQCATNVTVPEGCAVSGTDRGSDIQYAGAGSNADYLWFSVATYQPWSNLYVNAPYVQIDTTGDGKPDYEVDVAPAAATDVYLATTYDLNDDGNVVDEEPVNFNFGDVDTNVFDSGAVVIPVEKSALGLTGASQPISYLTATFNPIYSVTTDKTGPIAYNAATAPLRTASPLYADQGGTSIPLTGTGAAQALVLHLHGAVGQQAQVLARP